MVLYEIATKGKIPFDDIESDEIIKRSICEGKRPDINLLTDVPKEYKEIMIKCWAPNPQDRPTMAHVYEVLDKLHREILLDTEVAPNSISNSPSPLNNNKLKYLSPGIFHHRPRSCSSISRTSLSSNLDLPPLLREPSDMTRSSSQSSFTSSASSDDFDYMSYKCLAETDPSDKFYEENLSDFDYLKEKPESVLLRKGSVRINDDDLYRAYEFEKNEQYLRAFRIFEKHAKLGSAEAQLKAGLYLRYGRVKRGNNHSKARHEAAKYFYKSAKQGNPDAQYEYGEYIICPSKTLPSTKEQRDQGIEFIKKAVNQKHIKAMELYHKLLSKDGPKYGVELNQQKANELKTLIEQEKINIKRSALRK